MTPRLPVALVLPDRVPCFLPHFSDDETALEKNERTNACAPAAAATAAAPAAAAAAPAAPAAASAAAPALI